MNFYYDYGLGGFNRYRLLGPFGLSATSLPPNVKSLYYIVVL